MVAAPVCRMRRQAKRSESVFWRRHCLHIFQRMNGFHGATALRRFRAILTHCRSNSPSVHRPPPARFLFGAAGGWDCGASARTRVAFDRSHVPGPVDKVSPPDRTKPKGRPVPAGLSTPLCQETRAEAAAVMWCVTKHGVTRCKTFCVYTSNCSGVRWNRFADRDPLHDHRPTTVRRTAIPTSA